jgi:hypothetical protein
MCRRISEARSTASSTSKTILAPRRICPWQLKFLYNGLDFDNLIAAGEVMVCVKKSRPAPPEAGQLPGALSQFRWYFLVRTQQIIAKVHCYENTDGTIGASGDPDPKKLVIYGADHVPAHPEIGDAFPCCTSWRLGTGAN